MYPISTVVRIKSTGKKGIVEASFLQGTRKEYLVRSRALDQWFTDEELEEVSACNLSPRNMANKYLV